MCSFKSCLSPTLLLRLGHRSTEIIHSLGNNHMLLFTIVFTARVLTWFYHGKYGISKSQKTQSYIHWKKLYWPISAVFFCRIYIASWKCILLSSDYKRMVIYHLPYSVLFSTFSQNTIFIVTIPVTEWE